jgi:hypothetical protein
MMMATHSPPLVRASSCLLFEVTSAPNLPLLAVEPVCIHLNLQPSFSSNGHFLFFEEGGGGGT